MKKNFMIFIGSIILACGLYFFLLQHDIAAGGVSGMSLIVNRIFGFNLGTVNLVINIIIMILGYIFISPKFVYRSILSAATLSLTFIVLERLFPDVIFTNDRIINIIFGPLLVSIGLGLIFYFGGSSGGTDVIASILHKYTNTPIAISLFLTDFFVIILSAIFLGIEKTLYAILAIIIQTISLDYFIQGLGRKIALMVISDKNEEINHMLTHKYKRGVTLLKAEGGYTGRDKKLILTISTVRRYPILRDEILKVDDRAFIFTYTISEVLGEGFTISQLS